MERLMSVIREEGPCEMELGHAILVVHRFNEGHHMPSFLLMVLVSLKPSAYDGFLNTV